MAQPLPTSVDIPLDRSGRPRIDGRKAFRVQMNVIGALIMRELHTRYGRENVGYLWLILEPMLLATAVALIHSRSASHFASDMKPVPFAILGYCNYMTFRGIVNRAEGAIEGNAPLLYHRTVTILDILVSRAMLEAAGTNLCFLILMGLTIAIGMSELPQRPLLLIAGMIAMFILCTALSLIICAATHDNRAIGRLVHPMSYIMLPLSGAFIPMSWVPPGFRDVLSYVPLVHAFEILRYGMFRSATLDYVDFGYLAAWLMGGTLIGLLAISTIRGRIHLQ